eukprot:TRINITY_DN12915_c0_g1_i24.p4 TRINITY_DN12915_c0_g1~~TRINITY_DN12915_c0_g1_i24.p4  ORF type:complete len:164 (-),score=1.02 TRINITY_DN12915_c0_g1_i24:276-767(-)
MLLQVIRFLKNTNNKAMQQKLFKQILVFAITEIDNTMTDILVTNILSRSIKIQSNIQYYLFVYTTSKQTFDIVLLQIFVIHTCAMIQKHVYLVVVLFEQFTSFLNKSNLVQRTGIHNLLGSLLVDLVEVIVVQFDSTFAGTEVKDLGYIYTIRQQYVYVFIRS